MLPGAGRDKFPRYREDAAPRVPHNSRRTAGAADLLQPPPACRDIPEPICDSPRQREGLTDISHWQLRHISPPPSDPSNFPVPLLRFAVLKWDKAFGVLWKFTWDSWLTAVEPRLPRETRLDYLVTYIHAGNSGAEIILELFCTNPSLAGRRGEQIKSAESNSYMCHRKRAPTIFLCVETLKKMGVPVLVEVKC